LITPTKRTQWEKRGGVGGAKEWWSRLSDGQSVDLGSMGYELKALNMHNSMVVDPQTVLDFCFMGYELKALDMQHNNNTG